VCAEPPKWFDAAKGFGPVHWHWCGSIRIVWSGTSLSRRADPGVPGCLPGLRPDRVREDRLGAGLAPRRGPRTAVSTSSTNPTPTGAPARRPDRSTAPPSPGAARSRPRVARWSRPATPPEQPARRRTDAHHLAPQHDWQPRRQPRSRRAAPSHIRHSSHTGASSWIATIPSPG